ncbi:MAG: NAD(P)-binding protein [Candidatus Eremiobacteraeota bacterium]|nr:NAD(P)-binding protein [Candidatus Eremiobacteraeota bacterium]MCW5868706.1 NAD(P)-binding protein [Candidatus Eremiobacteraeota bacterium]
MENKPTCAVIGGGVAGIVAAHLLQRRYQVDLWESQQRLGGHSNTFEVLQGEDAGLKIDTGFIVFNGETYPLFQRFLTELGVAKQISDMSFGYFCEKTGWGYGGHDLNTFFAQRDKLFHPDFWRFAADLARFNVASSRRLRAGRVEGSLRDYLRGYTRTFVRHYIQPLGSSVWSAPLDKILDFPAQTFVRFFANHGLLRVVRRPDWFTVLGGSRSYIQAFLRSFQGRVRLSSPVCRVLPVSDGYEVEGNRYEKVVLATHADIALAQLRQPTPLQRQLLKNWRYLANRAVLHQDTTLLPANPRLRASWNYRRGPGSEQLPTLTYDMNRLQSLASRRRYLVTLNPQREIDASLVLGEWIYHHPQFDQNSEASQALLPRLNDGTIAFCGSYHRFGFHEDAVMSAAAAAASLGCPW